MGSEFLIQTLHSELRAAGSDLVGNDDLLRGVLAGCGDCIKVLDLDGRLQFMSEGGKRVMEVEDFSLLKGCPWPAFWVGDGNADAAEAVETAKAGGTGRFRGPANTAKGNPRYWDVQGRRYSAPMASRRTCCRSPATSPRSGRRRSSRKRSRNASAS